jgi:glucokinase
MVTEPRRHLGLDLGGTNIKVAVVEERDGDDLHLVLRERHPTEGHRGPEDVRRLAEVGQEALERHGAVGTVGVGVPGVFHEEAGHAVKLPNLPGDWHGVPIRAPLAGALGHPVATVNDAHAFSLAESLLGAARGLGTVVCLVLGTGVGGGIVVDGRLLRGTGHAGEIGHQTVLFGGPRCGCGNAGCAEALTRADVFARLGGRATAAEVYAAARAGDATALAAVEHVAKWLGSRWPTPTCCSRPTHSWWAAASPPPATCCSGRWRRRCGGRCPSRRQSGSACCPGRWGPTRARSARPCSAGRPRVEGDHVGDLQPDERQDEVVKVGDQQPRPRPAGRHRPSVGVDVLDHHGVVEQVDAPVPLAVGAPQPLGGGVQVVRAHSEGVRKPRGRLRGGQDLERQAQAAGCCSWASSSAVEG